MPLDETSQQVANALRALRHQHNWSLDRASEATGVSKAMLGQIERGESSPTVATLWKIATGFGVSLSSLLEPKPEIPTTTQLRRVAKLRRNPGGDQMTVAPLLPFEPGLGFEIFELTIEPGDERHSEPHEAGVTEIVIVAKGKMEVLIDSEWQTLNEGDALRFAADKPHGYRNRGRKPAVFYDVIRYSR
ncbi:helix-turn-helix domain-containing protein [Permianibacter aggregans]|uniref:XRE family transcriptional regulator n=1 Tax=Permianibacter aggregans TaxID=1510150 RepID=A0A4R6URX1_9GAMM|nr:XRE family transcriptional regulator [Permianibacter aggregans]QGX39487.1 XRE family transcriptional regulator [Permianibacter aggregans]TDQ49772.1 XRE family transcriptional regulator [Permianibacter aggregans]